VINSRMGWLLIRGSGSPARLIAMGVPRTASRCVWLVAVLHRRLEVATRGMAVRASRCRAPGTCGRRRRVRGHPVARAEPTTRSRRSACSRAGRGVRRARRRVLSWPIGMHAIVLARLRSALVGTLMSTAAAALAAATCPAARVSVVDHVRQRDVFVGLKVHVDRGRSGHRCSRSSSGRGRSTS
jgi:hypothetical protein